PFRAIRTLDALSEHFRLFINIAFASRMRLGRWAVGGGLAALAAGGAGLARHDGADAAGAEAVRLVGVEVLYAGNEPPDGGEVSAQYMAYSWHWPASALPVQMVAETASQGRLALQPLVQAAGDTWTAVEASSFAFGTVAEAPARGNSVCNDAS